MKIKHFHVKIHTGKVDVKLKPDVNILVGFNGSGKTLLLEALADYARRKEISFGFFQKQEIKSYDKALAWLSQAFISRAKFAQSKGNWLFMQALEKKAYSPLAHYAGGEKRLLRLLAFLLENKDCDLILIDEIETGLHIELQEEIIDIIRSICRSSQLVIATHSPAIMMRGWFDKVIQMEKITKLRPGG